MLTIRVNILTIVKNEKEWPFQVKFIVFSHNVIEIAVQNHYAEFPSDRRDHNGQRCA